MEKDDLLLEGILYFQLGDRKRAAAVLYQYVKANQTSVEGWVWLGRCQELPRRAATCYRQALLLDPANEQAREALARLRASVALAQAQAAPVPPAPPQENEASAQQVDPPASSAASAPAQGGEVSEASAYLSPAESAPDTGLPAPNEAPAPEKPAGWLEKTKEKLGLWLHPEQWPDLLLSWVIRSQRGILIGLMILACLAGLWRMIGPPLAVSYMKQAEDLVNSRHFDQARSMLSWMLFLDPWNDRSLTLQAIAYLNGYVNLTSREKDIYINSIEHAIPDIDRAIRIGSPNGWEYYVRYQIYDTLADLSDYRVDTNYLLQIAQENLLVAVQLGYGNEIPPREVALNDFRLGQCQQGFDQINPLFDAQPDDQPSAGLNTVYASGLAACGGSIEESLSRIERALQIQTSNSRFYDRALYLYYLNRKDESLDLLDALIGSLNRYWDYGESFYLRAIIRYEKGDEEGAWDDLGKGHCYTWTDQGFSDYLFAQMALRVGDYGEAIHSLQEAEAKMNTAQLVPFRKRVVQQLKDLNAQPVEKERSVDYIATPIPAVKSK